MGTALTGPPGGEAGLLSRDGIKVSLGLMRNLLLQEWVLGWARRGIQVAS